MAPLVVDELVLQSVHPQSLRKIDFFYDMSKSIGLIPAGVNEPSHFSRTILACRAPANRNISLYRKIPKKYSNFRAVNFYVKN